jgi:hypothetical protein
MLSLSRERCYNSFARYERRDDDMCKHEHIVDIQELVIPTDEELNLLEVSFKERKVDLGIVI